MHKVVGCRIEVAWRILVSRARLFELATPQAGRRLVHLQRLVSVFAAPSSVSGDTYPKIPRSFALSIVSVHDRPSLRSWKARASKDPRSGLQPDHGLVILACLRARRDRKRASASFTVHGVFAAVASYY